MELLHEENIMDESKLKRLNIDFDKEEFEVFGKMIDQWINNQFEGVKREVNIINNRDEDLLYYEVSYKLNDEIIFRYGTLAKVSVYEEKNLN